MKSIRSNSLLLILVLIFLTAFNSKSLKAQSNNNAVYLEISYLAGKGFASEKGEPTKIIPLPDLSGLNFPSKTQALEIGYRTGIFTFGLIGLRGRNETSSSLSLEKLESYWGLNSIFSIASHARVNKFIIGFEGGLGPGIIQTREYVENSSTEFTKSSILPSLFLEASIPIGITINRYAIIFRPKVNMLYSKELLNLGGGIGISLNYNFKL